MEIKNIISQIKTIKNPGKSNMYNKVEGKIDKIEKKYFDIDKNKPSCKIKLQIKRE